MNKRVSKTNEIKERKSKLSQGKNSIKGISFRAQKLDEENSYDRTVRSFKNLNENQCEKKHSKVTSEQFDSLQIKHELRKKRIDANINNDAKNNPT